MAAANIGSANASMRSAATLSSRMASTGVITDMRFGAKTYISTAMNVMTTMPMATERRAKLRVSAR